MRRHGAQSRVVMGGLVRNRVCVGRRQKTAAEEGRFLAFGLGFPRAAGGGEGGRRHGAYAVKGVLLRECKGETRGNRGP